MVAWVQRNPLLYVAVTVPLLLFAWEWFARQFTTPAPAQPPLAALTLPLYDCKDEAPARLSPHPRLLILGNSQIHYVRDQANVQQYGFPAKLQEALATQQTPMDVADLSEGGQQVVESLAILIDTFDRVRPDHVVLGLGLANMRGITIPPQLASSLDWEAVRAVTRRHCDGQVEPELATTLLQLYHPPQDTVVPHEPTIQEQFDECIADWLDESTATVHQRLVMADWVAKLPGHLERDVRQLWRKKARGQFKARTYSAGPHYELSLAAVELMAAYCREKDVPFTIIAMPFHPTCEPILYVPDDEHRLMADLHELETQSGIQLLDLRGLLDAQCFGTFPDGSPDGLHYLASGHARLGTEVAKYFQVLSDEKSSPHDRLRFAESKDNRPLNRSLR